MKYNPTTVSFVHPTENVDGTPFGPGEYAGTEFAYRQVGETEWRLTVAIPVDFTTTSVPLAELSLPQNVALELTARTVAQNGLKSAWAAPSNAFKFDTRVPNAPSVTVE
jgi:hypothetical protein